MAKNFSIHVIQFHLAMSAEEYLPFYQGTGKDILVRSTDNRSIRFPAHAIRQHITQEGIHGLFEIKFDKSNKLLGVDRVKE